MGSLQGASGAKGASLTPLHICPNCAAYVVAATWSERVSDRCVRNVWSCGCAAANLRRLPIFQSNRRQTEAVSHNMRCAIQRSAQVKPPHTPPASMNSSFFAARLQASNFDVVLRKLIAKTQCFSQRIDKTSMMRFHTSVDLNDIVLIRQAMSRDDASHDTPINRRRNIERTDCSAALRPRKLSVASCLKYAVVYSTECT